MADAVEPAEFLDVDVQQLAGLVALITANRLGRLQVLQPRQAGARATRLIVAGDTPVCRAMCWPCWRNAAISSATAAAVRLGLVLGRDERSAMPARRRPGSARATAPSLSPLHHMSAPLRLWKDRLPQLRGPSPLDGAASDGHSCGCSFGPRGITEASIPQSSRHGPMDNLHARINELENGDDSKDSKRKHRALGPIDIQDSILL